MLELDLILENAFCKESPDLGGRNQMCMRNLKYECFVGWSERGPVTVPVDRSLHLMGCGLSFASSPYVNQYSTTVNLF